MALTRTQVMLCISMLITGSLNTLSKKAQNDCSAPGIPEPQNNGTAMEHKFNHPWFQTLIMFIGEVTCLLGLAYSRYKERKRNFEIQKERLMVQPESSGLFCAPLLNLTYSRVFQFVIAIPTIFDLIGTSLAGIGLLYVDASVWQMLRGSIILFTGILSKIFLKRKLKPLQWLGMVVTMIGLIFVGLSGVFRDHGASGSKAILGIMFILIGQIVNASQMIVEEIFLKKRQYQPLQVVGMEGLFGIVFMCFIVLPAMYYIPGDQIGNRYENSLDALYQIKNNTALLIFSLLYLISIAFYNYFGLAVTKSLTAVHRTLIDACRTIVVWLSSLTIYYAVSEDFGEPFDKTYGGFQVDGFLFLLIGTALYNEIMDVPCIPSLRRSQEESYPSLINTVAVEEDAQTFINETSPLLNVQET